MLKAIIYQGAENLRHQGCVDMTALLVAWARQGRNYEIEGLDGRSIHNSAATFCQNMAQVQIFKFFFFFSDKILCSNQVSQLE